MEKIKVIFFSWDTFYGKLIRWHTGSKWTHVGLIARNKGSEYICFEAINQGLTKTKYSKELISKWESEGIVKIKTVTVPSANRLFKICEKYEGAPYDWISIFNIGWYAMFGKIALNFKGPKAVICSEFVARVLYDISASKIDFSKEYNKPFDLITPAEIFRSNNLK